MYYQNNFNFWNHIHSQDKKRIFFFCQMKIKSYSMFLLSSSLESFAEDFGLL